MHNEYGMRTGLAAESKLGGYRNQDELQQTAIDAAAILRRLVSLRGNYPTHEQTAVENHAVLLQKIIEIQGLLKL